MCAGLIAATSCEEKDNTPKTVDIEVSLEFDREAYVEEGINVDLRDLNGAASYAAETDANGIAAFKVPAGLYEASVSFAKVELTTKFLYNGVNSQIAVAAESADANKFVVTLTESKSSQLLIKELNFGACPDNEGTKTYGNAKYVILYNNGDTEIDASNICLAYLSPANSNANNKYLVEGKLTYEAQGWLPAPYAIWWFETDVKIAPYSQILVAMNGAIDHTATYTHSVDLSKADYVCYDPDSGYNMPAQYPAPVESIPTSNYLQTFVYGMGTAWPISAMCPAFFILEKADIADFVQNTANYDYTDSEKLPNVKIPSECVVDAVEVFNAAAKDKNNKRFPASIDSGYLMFTAKLGYTAYRNVDKEATEALPENEGKLVYNYAGGTADQVDGTTDPSGIDAEASIAAGAHIIYKDTNNSTNDFHQRKISSLK